MKRLAILGTFVIIAATPASVGLIGNASFSEGVPVRVPTDASLLDDAGRTYKPDDSRRRNAEPGDDHGGDRDRDVRLEDGDDHGGGGGDDSSGRSSGGSGGHGEDHGPDHS